MTFEIEDDEIQTFLTQMEKLTDEIRLLRETIAEASGLWLVRPSNAQISEG